MGLIIVASGAVAYGEESADKLYYENSSTVAGTEIEVCVGFANWTACNSSFALELGNTLHVHLNVKSQYVVVTCTCDQADLSNAANENCDVTISAKGVDSSKVKKATRNILKDVRFSVSKVEFAKCSVTDKSLRTSAFEDNLSTWIPIIVVIGLLLVLSAAAGVWCCMTKRSKHVFSDEKMLKDDVKTKPEGTDNPCLRYSEVDALPPPTGNTTTILDSQQMAQDESAYNNGIEPYTTKEFLAIPMETEETRL
ncbi:uncharacterized protein LOC143448883 isoform X2 [Clavelina lepadiformis]|uniref:uncharacterized protein LOC143448883 isoform X2 n=1 Tax=Clavelina lepadiformis TaxID=159417 RepID=UPI004041CA03